jgi:hypothetical protein
VLRPGGPVAVFWNVEQSPSELAAAFTVIFLRKMPDSLAARLVGATTNPDGYSVLGARADALRQAGTFDEPEQWRFDWERTYTRDERLDLLPTQGCPTRFPPARLAEVLAEIGAAVDATGGSFTVRYITMVVTALRTSTA